MQLIQAQSNPVPASGRYVWTRQTDGTIVGVRAEPFEVIRLGSLTKAPLPRLDKPLGRGSWMRQGTGFVVWLDPPKPVTKGRLAPAWVNWRGDAGHLVKTSAQRAQSWRMQAAGYPGRWPGVREEPALFDTCQRVAKGGKHKAPARQPE